MDAPALVVVGAEPRRRHSGRISLGARRPPRFEPGLPHRALFRAARPIVDVHGRSSRRASDRHRLDGCEPDLRRGRLWGMSASRMTGHCLGDRGTAREVQRVVATAIANAEGSAELAASRRRIVAAADEARRRIERDLHDGIQQRLIALTFRARAMTRRPPDELPGLAAELSEGLKEVSDELREVSRGIHPTILTEAGLGPALRALARRSNVPIDVDVKSTSGCRPRSRQPPTTSPPRRSRTSRSTRRRASSS